MPRSLYSNLSRAAIVLTTIACASLAMPPEEATSGPLIALKAKKIRQADSSNAPADPAATKIKLNKTTVTSGEAVVAEVELTNYGPGDASSLAVTFTLVPSIKTSTPPLTLKTVTAGSLPRNGTTRVVTSLPVSAAQPGGAYEVKAIVTGTSKDKTTTNNVVGSPLLVHTSSSTDTESPSTSPTTSDSSTSSTSSSVPSESTSDSSSSTSNPPSSPSSGSLASTTSTTAPASSSSCTTYQPFFDTLHKANASGLNSHAASGDGYTYYHFSYALDGVLGMFEGTRDVKYLEQALAWADTMVAKATIIDIHGKRNWKGPLESAYSPTPISAHLYDVQAVTHLARLARIVLLDATLRQKYGSRAEAIYRFVKNDIADKWRYSRKAESWYRTNAKTMDKPYSDKTALFVRIIVNLSRVDGNAGHLAFARELLEAFQERTAPFLRTSLIWDRGMNPSTNDGRSLDTSHANRWPYMMIDALEAGLVISREEVDGVAKLLTEVIWDQSTSSPRFTNFIDGENTVVFNRQPYGVGQIYSGWAALAVYSPRAFTATEATLKALIAGTRNPSLDYMSTATGKMALAGHITKAMRLTGRCQ